MSPHSWFVMCAFLCISIHYHHCGVGLTLLVLFSPSPTALANQVAL